MTKKDISLPLYIIALNTKQSQKIKGGPKRTNLMNIVENLFKLNVVSNNMRNGMLL